MSDIAVTWAKAQQCRDKDGVLDRNAKHTLVHLASYADANGEGWAAVWVLSLEMDVSERSVQRGLTALKAARLIRPTGRHHTFEGRRYPIYKLPIDEGYASTAMRLKAERGMLRNEQLDTTPVSPQEGANNDTGVIPSGLDTTRVSPQEALATTRVSPQEALATTPVSPQDDTGVTPPYDTGVTLIGNINTQGLKPLTRACAREAAIKAWGVAAPDKVAPRFAERAWLSAIERSGLRDEQLLAAVLAAVARDTAFERGMAKNLDRWLDEDRFEPWLSASNGMPLSVGGDVWAGPMEVALLVSKAMGPEAMASYLGKAAWDGGRRMVQVSTSIALERLTDGAGRALKAAGIGVERMAAGGARHG